MLARILRYVYKGDEETTNKIVERNVNLRVMPADCRNPVNKRLTQGDLHGNIINFIRFLIREGVMVLDQASHYSEIITIYEAHERYLKEKNPKVIDGIRRFEEIIHSATYVKPGMICQLGDETAGSGQNDWFFLLMMEQLGKTGIPIEVMLSNHGVEFLRNYFNNTLRNAKSILHEQAKSLLNLSKLLQMDQSLLGDDISENRANNIIQKYYLPNIKLLSYSTSPLTARPHMTVYSHAPIGMETIAAICESLIISYNTKTIYDLCQTINTINNYAEHNLKKIIQFIMNEVKEYHEDIGMSAISVKFPFLRLIWNHALDDYDLVTQDLVNFNHGHTGPRENRKSKTHVNLDTLLGRKDLLPKLNSRKYAYAICRIPYQAEITHGKTPLKQLTNKDFCESRKLKMNAKPQEESDSDSDNDTISLSTTHLRQHALKMKKRYSKVAYRQKEILGGLSCTVIFWILHYTKTYRIHDNEWLQLSSGAIFGAAMGALSQFIVEYKKSIEDQRRLKEFENALAPQFKDWFDEIEYNEKKTKERHDNRSVPLLMFFNQKIPEQKNNDPTISKHKFILIGLPGVGKSTTLKKCIELFKRKGITCCLQSSDDIIKQRFKMDDAIILKFQKYTGIKVPEEIFNAENPVLKFMEKFGEEPIFRDLEAMFVEDILKNSSQQDWFDLGGKAPLRNSIKNTLNDHQIVPIFLYAEHETILQRLANGVWKKRSNYLAAGEAKIDSGWNILAEQHRKERLEKYIDTSTIIVEVEKNPEDAFITFKSPDELVNEILYRMNELKLISLQRENQFTKQTRHFFIKSIPNILPQQNENKHEIAFVKN